MSFRFLRLSCFPYKFRTIINNRINVRWFWRATYLLQRNLDRFIGSNRFTSKRIFLALFVLQTPLRDVALLYVRLYRDVDQVIAKEEVRSDDVRLLPPVRLELDSEVSVNGIGHLPKSAGWIKENIQRKWRQFCHHRPQWILTIPRCLWLQNHFVQVLEQTLHGLLIAPYLRQGRPHPVVF